MKEIIQKTPKSELHVHLRGAMPHDTIIKLINKYTTKVILRDIPFWQKITFRLFRNIRPFLSQDNWTIDRIPDLFNYNSFINFLITWCFTRYLIRDVSDLKLLITGVLENLKTQNVVYAEITISIIEYIKRGISLKQIITCLDETTDYPGIRVQWIVDLVRDSGPKAAYAMLEEIIKLKGKNIVGITLGGSEPFYPARKFSKVYSDARKNGLRLSIHAGEAAGPKSIWDALQILHSDRIGHGVRAIEDKSLVKYLADNNIPLEICPTSNIQTRIFAKYEVHSLKSLLEAGVPVTINTDDPTFFKTTLIDEYIHVYNVGIKGNDIYKIIRNGFIYAFLPKDEIDEYIFDLENKWKILYSKN